MDANATELDFGDEGLSFKEIALRSFQECVKALSVELRGGYHCYSKDEDGGKEVYVPDSREVACNTIRAYALLIMPKFDKNMINVWSSFVKDLDKLESDFIGKTSVDESIVLGLDHYENKLDQYFLEEFKAKKLKLYIGLFEDLSKCTANSRYFGFGGGTFE